MKNNDLQKAKDNYIDAINQTPTIVWVLVTTTILMFVVYSC